MSYLGDYKEDTPNLGFEFTCWDTSGQPTALAGSPVVTVEKISDGTTKSSAEAYITLTEGIKSTVKIDLSGDAFFATGEDYSVYISAGTVDGGTVEQAVVGWFSIENRSQPNISVSSSGVSKPVKLAPDGFVIGSGENEVNDEDSTHAADGVYHEIEAIGPGQELINVYYEFEIGGDGLPISVTWQGFLEKGTGALKNLIVQAYNWAGATWDLVGTIDSGVTDEIIPFELFTSHVGTGANVGLVRIRFFTGSVPLASNTNLKTNKIFITFTIVPAATGYSDGAIWVNTNASNENTEVRVDGIASNPVSTWAAALALSVSLNITRFHIINGSTITLSANSDHYTLLGDSWTLALNGQSVVGIHISGATVSGIAAGTGDHQIYESCVLNACSHIKDSHFLHCGVAGTQTVVEAGDYFFVQCHSAIAGTDTWIFDFGDAIGDTRLNFRLCSSGIQLESMGDTGTDIASIEGFGQIIEGTCTGGIVAVRGHFTTSGITNLELVDDARYTLTQVNATVDQALADYDGPTNAEMVARFNTVDTLVNAIKAVTDLLPDSGALSSLATAAVVNGIQADLSNAVDGLGALKALLDAIPTTAMRGTDNAALAATAFNAAADAVTLAATGLDDIAIAEVTGLATKWSEMIVQLWRAEYKKRILHKTDDSSGTMSHRNDADDANLLQAPYTEDATDQTMEESS